MPKFTVYLAKEDFNSRPRYIVSRGTVTENNASVFGLGVTSSQEQAVTQFISRQKLKPKLARQSASSPNAFFRQSSRRQQPWWAQMWGITERISIQSADALVVIEADGRIFMVTHGQGRALINPLCIVQDFGLRTALNVLDPSKLRSTDLFTPSEVAMTTHKRSGKDARLQEYDIDVYNTLLKAVRGKCLREYEDILSSVDGTDSLKFAFEGSAAAFAERCLTLLELYDSTKYIELGFGWIDNFRQIRDKSLIQNLDRQLLDAINARNPSPLVLLPYTFLGLSDVYFSILRVSRRYSSVILPEISIADYYRMLDRAQIVVSTDDLKKHQIQAIDYETGGEIASFSVYQSIYFETTIGSNSYFMESGIWYVVSPTFLSEIDGLIADLVAKQIDFSFPFRIDTLATSARQEHRNKEYIYNRELAQHLSSAGRLFFSTAI